MGPTALLAPRAPLWPPAYVMKQVGNGNRVQNWAPGAGPDQRLYVDSVIRLLCVRPGAAAEVGTVSCDVSYLEKVEQRWSSNFPSWSVGWKTLSSCSWDEGARASEHRAPRQAGRVRDESSARQDGTRPDVTDRFNHAKRVTLHALSTQQPAGESLRPRLTCDRCVETFVQPLMMMMMMWHQEVRGWRAATNLDSSSGFTKATNPSQFPGVKGQHSTEESLIITTVTSQRINDHLLQPKLTWVET